MREVYILSACRTAIGRFLGSFRDTPAVDLGAVVIQEAVKRAKVQPEWVQEVIMGLARQAGCGPNPARQMAMKASLPQEVPAYTVNKACGSGMKAIALAYQSILLGEADFVVAGGAENMTRVPFMLDRARFGYRLGHATLMDGMYKDGFLDPIAEMVMGETAERLAEKYSIPREEQDKFAFSSQQKAAKAIEEGRFQEEIVPVTVKGEKGAVIEVTKDEHPRPGTTLEQLASLPPVFKKNGTVTAGNSSGITDGAAAVVLASKKGLKKAGVEPLAVIGGVASAGVDPKEMGMGPVPAVQKLLKKRGTRLTDYEWIELNEAFAAQVLAVLRELPLPLERLNANGGAIALGHPIGCTGARIVVTLLYQMKRRDAKCGLATLCISGGQGMAIDLLR